MVRQRSETTRLWSVGPVERISPERVRELAQAHVSGDRDVGSTVQAYAAVSAQGSITILVTFSFLSRQTSYIAGALSRVMR